MLVSIWLTLSCALEKDGPDLRTRATRRTSQSETNKNRKERKVKGKKAHHNLSPCLPVAIEIHVVQARPLPECQPVLEPGRLQCAQQREAPLDDACAPEEGEADADDDG
jgi:hypothetical protein